MQKPIQYQDLKSFAYLPWRQDIHGRRSGEQSVSF